MSNSIHTVDLTRDPWHRRFVHFLRRLLRPVYRPMSAIEYELSSKVGRLESAIQDRDRQIDSLRYDLERNKSELKIAGLEIEKLSAIAERDRKRVEAETAIHVRNAEAALGRIASNAEPWSRVT